MPADTTSPPVPPDDRPDGGASGSPPAGAAPDGDAGATDDAHAGAGAVASGRARRRVLALASVASFMVALDLLVVTTALDTIRHDLGASPSSLQWALTAYSLSFATLLMAGAAVGDRVGRRRALAAGLGVFVAGSAAAALSGSVGALVAARVVQGAGAALILPLGLTIVSAAYPPDRRGAAIGALEGVTGLAIIAGPLVGGVVVDRLAWEWVFWANVPIGLVAIPLVLAGVPESHGPDRRLDGRGLLLVGGAGFAAVWALVRGNEVGWGDPQIVVAAAAALVLGAGFVAWERRAPAPMLPLRFFAARGFSAGTAAAFLLNGSLYASVFFMAQYLQAGLGHDAMAAGLRLVPWTATLLVVAPLAGALADRHGPRPVLATGLALQAAGLAWLGLVAEPGLGYATMVGPVVLAGIGCSAAIPVAQAAVVGAVADADVGKAAGANNMLQELGGAVGVAVAVAAFAGAGSYATAAAVTDGFTAAMAAAVALSALAMVAALLLPRRPAPRASEARR